jgi:hypothetical protein
MELAKDLVEVVLALAQATVVLIPLVKKQPKAVKLGRKVALR